VTDEEAQGITVYTAQAVVDQERLRSDLHMPERIVYVSQLSVPREADQVKHKQCRDAECNICRGDTHVIGPNPDTAIHVGDAIRNYLNPARTYR
jgi:hypothetical protein